MIESTLQQEVNYEINSLLPLGQQDAGDASSAEVLRPVSTDVKLRKSRSHEAHLCRSGSIEISPARPALRKLLPLEEGDGEGEGRTSESDRAKSVGERFRQHAYKGALSVKPGAFGNSDPVRSSNETVPPTPLSALLGKGITNDLDARFASAQPPFSGPNSHKGVHPWERSSDGNVKVTPDLVTIQILSSDTLLDGALLKLQDGAMDVQALVSGTCYLWAVTLLGRLIVGQEVPALPPVMLEPRKGATE